jgi:hypothetical protein
MSNLNSAAEQFRRTITHLFEKIPTDVPQTREEYTTLIQKPIRSLSELNVGEEYMIRVRGSYILQRGRLDEIYITATNGVSFSFMRESSLALLHTGAGATTAPRPCRIPESVHQDDVWFYYTPERIDLLLEGYDQSNSGYATPATGARTPNSMAGTMTPSQRSGVTTPKSKDATMTPSTRSGTATPGTVTSNSSLTDSISNSGTSTPKSQLGVPLILEANAVDADKTRPRIPQ